MPKRIVTTSENVSHKKQKTFHWSSGLVQAVQNPELLVLSDDLVYVIKDKYPKSQCHFLIICKKDIGSLSDVKIEDIDLLKHMNEMAEKMKKSNDEYRSFNVGYHAEPSMSRLHLHVISDDMDSSHLKTKKHWNSFTTEFFISSEVVIENLIKNKKVILPSKEECRKFLELPLKCHKCDFKPKNMPDLKKHIVNHC
ncbi:hypothetical protein HHI36_001892 [Cryptolaemus montrouzieri]|uniref:HIT domain-containing protein n=1 Tax=Cryptolaemus montrouzieri TaxID=559131 RepID=A0ABD2PA95_9CUCU